MVFVKERYEQTGNYNGSIEETTGYHSNAIGHGLSVYSPGWSIDNYRANGFSQAELRFTSVEGPGRVVLRGTPSLKGTLPPRTHQLQPLPHLRRSPARNRSHSRLLALHPTGNLHDQG